MHTLSIAALIAVTSLPVTLPHPPPAVASHPIAGAQMQNQNANFYRPFFRQQPQEPAQCRIRAFFGSDIAKPLETVYFARPGSPCAGVPLYGFVFLTR